MKKNSLILFLTIALLSCNDNNKIAELHLDKNLIDLDTINLNKKIYRHFNITNTGNEILKIYDIESSCGCTVVKLKDSLVYPLKATTVKVEIIPNQKGLFERSIVIRSNTKKIFNILDIKGYVK